MTSPMLASIRPPRLSIQAIGKFVLCGGFSGLVLLWVVAVAWAGQYHVYSCTDPVTHAPLPTSGWAETPGIVVRAENGCAKGEPISASVVPGLPRSASSWTFSAPSDTKIVAATLYREVSVNTRAKAFWAAPENSEADQNVFDLCGSAIIGEPGINCRRGNIISECKTTCGRLPYAPADTLVVPSSHLPARQLAFDVVCPMQGCYGYEDLRSADIVLEQSTGPTATATGGSLTSASTVRGVADIEVTASDPASGVFQAILQADGKTVARQIIDADNGTCEYPTKKNLTAPTFSCMSSHVRRRLVT